MDAWQTYEDPRFRLRFRYPERAADGEPVERLESEQGERLRVHILAPNSRTVYFEVTRYPSLSAEAEYRMHRDVLGRQSVPRTVTDLHQTTRLNLPAFVYGIQWEQGQRIALLFERADATYRIVYNPLFEVNLQILATLEWIT